MTQPAWVFPSAVRRRGSQLSWTFSVPEPVWFLSDSGLVSSSCFKSRLMDYPSEKNLGSDRGFSVGREYTDQPTQGGWYVGNHVSHSELISGVWCHCLVLTMILGSLSQPPVVPAMSGWVLSSWNYDIISFFVPYSSINSEVGNWVWFIFVPLGVGLWLGM